MERIVCPSCGHEVPVGDNCAQCGLPLPKPQAKSASKASPPPRTSEAAPRPQSAKKPSRASSGASGEGIPPGVRVGLVLMVVIVIGVAIVQNLDRTRSTTAPRGPAVATATTQAYAPSTRTLRSMSTRQATAVLLPTATPSYDAEVVADSMLNLRAGPGDEYDVLGSYPRGTWGMLTGKSANGEWLRVRTPDGKTGWMWAAYLVVKKPLSQVPVVAAP